MILPVAWLSHIPTVNACFNTTSACLLAAGYFFIRRGNVLAHKTCMLSAFACSILFLTGYLYYHAHAGVIHYQGTGLHRLIYFSILTTHTILAIVIVPLILRVLFLAFKERFEEHRKWAKVTLPLWFYVSVTGVVVYGMLYF